MQFGPHQDAKKVTKQLLKLVKEAPVDEIMFFYFAEEMNDGHDTLERIKRWIEHSRPYRQALADAGILISLNPWHTLLHGDRGRTLKEGQNWQTMVDQNGRSCTAVVCPFDENWRAYYEETLKLYAAEDFRVIWIDDDIRYHNHSPLDWGGCFCPLHVAEFNRRAGAEASREEIVANCTAPGEPHPWREIWFDMLEEKHLEIINRWREIVEAGGSRLGLMSSTAEAHSAEGRRWKDWWRAFGGGKPPVHRPSFWGYFNVTEKELPEYMGLLDQNRSVQPEKLESGPEIECFSYGRWRKSFRQIGAQMALAHIMGSTNLNISLYDFMGNDPGDEPERVDFLKRRRPISDWLADEFPMSMRPTGVGVPWSEDLGRKIHTDGSGKWQSFQIQGRGWANVLGAAGHSFTMRPSESVNALGGAGVWGFDDDELTKWLAKGVLLDGVGAYLLVQRGFGELIGLKSSWLVSQDELTYSVEHALDENFALRLGAETSINGKPYSKKILQGELLDGVRVVQDIRSATNQPIGHGMILFENEAGGRVAIVPWQAMQEVDMNIQRAVQLTKTLNWLDPERSHGWAEGAAWLVPQFLAEGARWRGVVWNAGPDEVESFTVHPPAAMGKVTSAIHVSARGERIEAKVDGDSVRLPQPMYQWEFVVLF
jgi:hypothetical protein